MLPDVVVGWFVLLLIVCPMNSFFFSLNILFGDHDYLELCLEKSTVIKSS